MKHQPVPLPLLVSAAIGTVGGALGIAWYASNQINPTPRRTYLQDYTFTPWELGVSYEQITLHTPDGLKLRGWWLPQPAAQSVVIGCHGHIGGKHDLLGIGTGLWRAGHNVLLFDFRGRGESDPWPNTLVSREVDDLLTAIAFVQQRLPGGRIGVIGFSMGAAVTILAAAQQPDVLAVVADSSFTSARDLIGEHMRQILRVPPGTLVALTDVLNERRHGYRLSHVRPIDAIRQIAPRPVLIIHGGGDTLIRPAHAHRLFAAACQPKELWICPDCEHCGAYFADRHRYVARVAAFFGRHLCP